MAQHLERRSHPSGVDFQAALDVLQCMDIRVIMTPEQQMLEGLEVLGRQNSGRMITATIRGSREDIEAAIRRGEPLYYELLPLSLEEIFLAETEVQGYDAKKLIL